MKNICKFILVVICFGLILITSGCNEGSSSINNPFGLKEITTFSLPGKDGPVAASIVGSSISLVMPYGSNINNLSAKFTTTGQKVTVNGVTQISGQTTNDFAQPLTYIVTAADKSTHAYIVTVIISKSDSKAITQFSLDNYNGAIVGNNINVTLPYGTPISSLNAIFTTTGQKVTVNGVTQVSGQTTNDFSHPVTYIVTAADKNTREYAVIVTIAKSDSKAITQFSLDGYAGTILGNNINVTVPYGTTLTSLIATFNTTGQKVTVNGVNQISGLIANNFVKPVIYVVTASDNSSRSYTVTVTVAKSEAKAITQFSLDGYAGNILGDNIVVTVPYGTKLTDLIATFITTGAKVTVNGVTQISGQTPNEFSSSVTYVVTAVDKSTNSYTVTVTVAQSDAKAITQFSLDGYAGTILGDTINVTMPYGTTLTSLIAIFNSTGVKVTADGTTQISGVTADNFSAPVTYVVTAADNTKRSYIVTVNIANSDAKAITQFSLDGYAGTISGNNVSITVPYGTAVNSLIAAFNTTGVKVTVDGTTQINGVTANDFTQSVIYIVTAADNTTRSYTVTVTVAKSDAKTITQFFLDNTPGAILGDNIVVTVPYGTNVTDLIATFSTSGGEVTIGGTTQISGVTPNDFTQSVIYIVTAADNTTRSYTVTVIVAESNSKSITQFSLNGSSGTIFGNNISVTVPYGTMLSSLIATFNTTGTQVTVNGATQISGVTANNFSAPVTYVVTAADNTTRSYTVTVSVANSNAKAITQFSLDSYAGTISGNNINVNVPYGTKVTNLVAQFTTTGAEVSVDGVNQINGATANSFINPLTYVVTADNRTQYSYIVTVTVAKSDSKAITQFFLDNAPAVISGNSIDVQVPYGTNLSELAAVFTTTGTEVTVNGVTQISGQTFHNFSAQVTYVVTAADNTTRSYTVTVTVAKSSSKIITWFWLDDSVGTILGDEISVTVPYGTSINALIARFNSTGTEVTVNGVTQISGQTSNNFSAPVTYVVTAADNTTRSYTVTVTVAKSDAKSITQFSLDSKPGFILLDYIFVTLPYGTDVTHLAATFTTTGTEVAVNGTKQVSGVTANNFSTPVTYVVTASDKSIQSYNVIVTIAPSNAKSITKFSLNGYIGNISGNDINVNVPIGTSLKDLVATFNTTGQKVTVNGVIQVSGQTSNDFSTPLTYVVTAADGTTQSYNVIVTIAPSNAKSITRFSLNGYIGNISGNNINVNVPIGTNLKNLVATFTTTGTEVTVNGTKQVSGQTSNDFSAPVTYLVTAADKSIQNYTVTTKFDNHMLFICSPDGQDLCGCLTQNDGSNLMWYHSDLTNGGNGYTFAKASSALTSFNAEGHCGHNDWRLPSVLVSGGASQGYLGSNIVPSTSDFGSLGHYAATKGYVVGGNLTTWLNSNGFLLDSTCGSSCGYWSSSKKSSDISWNVFFSNGIVQTTFDTYSNNLLFVRGGE